MFTLSGAVIGFIAMLAARGRAGIAAGLAMLGILLGIGGSIVFGIEVAQSVDSPQAFFDTDFSLGEWIAGGLAALPGVAGALLARRD